MTNWTIEWIANEQIFNGNSIDVSVAFIFVSIFAPSPSSSSSTLCLCVHCWPFNWCDIYWNNNIESNETPFDCYCTLNRTISIDCCYCILCCVRLGTKRTRKIQRKDRFYCSFFRRCQNTFNFIFFFAFLFTFVSFGFEASATFISLAWFSQRNRSEKRCARDLLLLVANALSDFFCSAHVFFSLLLWSHWAYRFLSEQSRWIDWSSSLCCWLIADRNVRSNTPATAMI